MTPATPTRLDLINLGDELLLGLRENSHLATLGRILSKHGLPVHQNVVVRDRPEEIERAFRPSWEAADVVVTTGGLGPTADDLTRETIARLLGLELRHDEAVAAAIRERFARFGRKPTENNLRQARVPAGAEILENPYGTAPGIWYQRDGKTLAMLPGPTSELVPMLEQQLLPRLRAAGLAAPAETFLQLRTCGVGESRLETLLSPAFEPHGGSLEVGFCAHGGLVDVRLAAAPGGGLDPRGLAAVSERCQELLGDSFVGLGEPSLAELVLSQVRALGRVVAVAESCTGGLLANALTGVPGASKVFVGGVVCYTNAAKVQILDVPDVILQQHGAVSAECAAAMATGAAETFDADYTLSVTGFAGPDGGTVEDPVGTVFIGYHSPVGVWSRRVRLPGGRRTVMRRAVTTSLDWMRRKLKEYEVEDVVHSMHI